MKEVEHIYFIDGEKVEREFINWEYTTGVTIIGDEIHVDFDPQDITLVYDWTEGAEQEETESDLKILCNILSLVGGGAYPGMGLKIAQLDNLAQPESHSYQAKNYPVESTPVSPLAGVKHNKFKAPLDIVQTRQFPKALQLIALATAFGNKKYEATDKDFLNFKRVAGGSQTYFDAAARHNAERNEVDEDSGLPHIIHSVWDSLAALELWIEENEVDTKDFSKNYLEYLHMSK